MFTGNYEKRKRYSDGVFIILWILFTLVTLGNLYQWGSQTYKHSAFQAGILCIMAFSYYLPLRIMNKSSRAFVAFFALLFVLSGGVFIVDFVLADLIPVNVLINWA